MKVEKINNNKAIIVLTLTELRGKKVSLKDIKEGKRNAQNFFFKLLEDANIMDDFTNDSSQLFIEVTAPENDVFMIIITKADCIPDIESFNTATKTAKNFYTVSSNIYSFSSLESLYNFCNKALEEQLYVGANSLYKFNDKYFLLFSNATIKNPNFVKTFSIISEYCEKYFSKQTTAFLEYANRIMAKNAIQTIQKI